MHLNLSKIPLIQSIYYFKWESHKKSIPKFFILWFLSSLPVLVSVSLTVIPKGDESIWSKLCSSFDESLTVPELFVYAASFLSPIIFILYERYKERETKEPFRKKLFLSIREVFFGYKLIVFLAFVILGITAIGFASKKTDVEFFKQTYLYWFVSSGAWILYTFSLFCWYLSILDSYALGGDFVEASRSDEKQLTESLNDRVENRPKEDE